MLHRYADQARQLYNPAAGIDTAVLAFDAATGADHAAVGGIVARHSKLPAVVAGVRALAALIAVGQRVVDRPNAGPLR